MKSRLSFAVFFGLSVGFVVAPAVVAQIAQSNCCAAAAAGGVTSLNALVGDLSLRSTDGSVRFVASGTSIDLSVATPTPAPSSGPFVALLPSPNPTTTPNNTQAGSLAVEYIFIDPNGPNHPTSNAAPNAIIWANGAGRCENSDFSSMGTSEEIVNGVRGELLALGCVGQSPYITCGGHGDCGFTGSLIGPRLVLSDSGYVEFPISSSALAACFLTDTFSNGVALSHGAGTGNCTFQLPDVAASSALAINATNQVEAASTLTTNDGEVTCPISNATSCSATATVRSGARCTTTMESTDTTVAQNLWLPPGVHTTTTTLTVTLAVSSAQTGTLAANYWCP